LSFFLSGRTTCSFCFFCLPSSGVGRLLHPASKAAQISSMSVGRDPTSAMIHLQVFGTTRGMLLIRHYCQASRQKPRKCLASVSPARSKWIVLKGTIASLPTRLARLARVIAPPLDLGLLVDC